MEPLADIDWEARSEADARYARRDRQVRVAMRRTLRVRLAVLPLADDPWRARALVAATLAGAALCGVALGLMLTGPLGSGPAAGIAALSASVTAPLALGGRPWVFAVGTALGAAAVPSSADLDPLLAACWCVASLLAWLAADCRHRRAAAIRTDRRQRAAAEQTLAALDDPE